MSSRREGQKYHHFKNFFYLTSKIFNFMHSFLKKGKTKKAATQTSRIGGSVALASK
jgi:hypothetical protein